MLGRLLALLGIGGRSVEDEVVSFIASQYELSTNAVPMDRPFRKFGEENGLDDEMNFVELVTRIEDRWRIQLPDGEVLDKAEVGLDMIPAGMTPGRLVAIVVRVLSTPR